MQIVLCRILLLQVEVYSWIILLPDRLTGNSTFCCLPLSPNFCRDIFRHDISHSSLFTKRWPIKCMGLAICTLTLTGKGWCSFGKKYQDHLHGHLYFKGSTQDIMQLGKSLVTWLHYRQGLNDWQMYQDHKNDAGIRILHSMKCAQCKENKQSPWIS